MLALIDQPVGPDGGVVQDLPWFKEFLVAYAKVWGAFLDTTAACDTALGGTRGICSETPQTCDTVADCPNVSGTETCEPNCDTACDAGGLCSTLIDAFAPGDVDKKTSQCDFFLSDPAAPNNFCNLGAVSIPLGTATGSYTADSGASTAATSRLPPKLRS